MRQMLFGLLLLFCVTGLAREPLQLATGEFAPFTGASLPDGGVASRIVRAAFLEAGYGEPRLQYLPWGRAYHLAKTAQVAGTFPYGWNRERATLFYFSSPIYIERIIWFSTKQNDKAGTGEWQGLRVCVPAGWNTAHLEPELKRFALRLEQPRELAQCLQLLDKGRVDLMAISDRVMQEASYRLFGEQWHFQPLPLYSHTNALYLIISRRHPHGQALIEAFNQGLAALRVDGRYDQLLE